ncbi:MAG: ATP-binding cassette domain-containing protein [Planctomycetaceae bacterium]|nr:MAG: ATP-binding cassette domain-containing protein [Planctomycetaceae bacterium]
MKYFLRSLKYLKPYRARLTAAVVCVLLIAVLWGGGLGMMLPGAKILLDEDKGGLHGWAWQSLVNDKMKVSAGVEDAPINQRAFSQPVFKVVRISSVKDGGPAATAGLATGDLIVGVQTGQKVQVLRGEELLQWIAEAPSDKPISLAVCNSRTGAERIVSPVLGTASYDSRALGYAVSFVPVPHSQMERYYIFVYLLIFAILITVLRAVFTFIQEYAVGTAIWQGIMDMRCENYNAVLHLPTTFFSEKGVSDATSRFIQDTAELARGQNTLLGKTLVEPAKAIATIVLAFAISWQLTLIAILAGPPAFLLIRTLGKKMHKASRRALESWSLMLEVLGETLIGIRVVKAYTMEGTERRRFFRVNRDLLRQQNKMERLDAASGPMVESLGIVAGAGAAAFAGYLVFVGTDWLNFGKMDSTKFLVGMAALFAIFDPVRKLAKVSLRFQASDAAAQRIFAMQDIPQEKSVQNAPTLPRHAKSIQFKNVSFRYPGGEEAVKDVNLEILFGQRVAVVGPNGSGKTTLLSLLPRLIDPTQGSILIDGVDVSSCSIRSLRRQIGLVTQDSVLFHATIGENIAYGLRRPKHDAVLSAAKQAYVDEFVSDKERFPAGYDTMVGEHGATLSGGQKQRISIARAILRDPAILIFDEATSQVDSDSERRIQDAMETFMTGRTCLLIAHRFATVMSADKIVVMNEGRIVDMGTHGELLARCELYQHLYRNQLGGAP